MKKKEPKILMLGWEFPPIINGGLGVACHDLCIALSKHARVTMVIPKTYPDFSIENLNLIGLNTIDAKTLRNISIKTIIKTEQVRMFPSKLNPYYSESGHGNEMPEIKSKYLTPVEIGDETVEVFNIEDLYGGDVIEKVTVLESLQLNWP
ncbi:MAG: glycogen/starch synthase [Bacteroidetes bacterium]|nr:glycogen/starch synthase [Bacteroidota bacterium]